MTSKTRPLRARLLLSALGLMGLVSTPADAGMLTQLLKAGAGAGVVVAAQHQYVHNTPRMVGADVERYNEANRRRAVLVQAAAPARELSNHWGERGAMMCGPYALYASFSRQLKGRSFEQFVAGLEERGQWGRSPDFGMNPGQLVGALQDLGFGLGDALDADEPGRLAQLYAAVDAGKLVLAVVDEAEVWPQASVWDKVHGRGRPRQAEDLQGQPHLVRVVGLQRDRGGRVAQVLLYDVNHPDSTLSVQQFEKVMSSRKRVFHMNGNEQLVFITHKSLERPQPAPAVAQSPARPNFN